MEGKNIQIPLRGIVRNTPATNGEDGEMEEIINARYKDGAMRPISSPEIYAYVAGYTNIFFHSNSGYKHILGVSNNKLYHIGNEINGVYSPLAVPFLIIYTEGKLSYTQIGNVVNVIDNKKLKYILWNNNEYIPIGSMFNEMPVCVELRVDAYDKYRYVTVAGDDNVDVIKGVVAKTLSYEKKYGRLNGFILACTAVELYDGTYIAHSQPVLLGQAYDDITRTILNNDVAPLIIELFNESTIIEDDYKEFPINNASVNYVTRNAVQKRVAGNLNYSCYHYDTPSSVKCVIGANKLQYQLSGNLYDDKFKNIIKSVGVFISKEVYSYDKDVCENISGGVYRLKLKTDAEIIKELTEDTQYYKVHNITYEELRTLTSNTWYTVDLKGKLGDNLVTNELLPIDNFTHHTLCPSEQFVNNSKLHIFDYEQLLFQGWDYVHLLSKQGTGQFYAIDKQIELLDYYIIVQIKTDNGVDEVCQSYKGQNITTLYFKPMLSYPDRRATKMIISAKITDAVTSEDVWFKYEYNLTPSETHNYAYYISHNLKPILNSKNLNSFEHKDGYTSKEVHSNILRVSEINNPFTYPASQTYIIGNGAIIGLATNAIPLSTGQFGEYPLEVFHSGGISAMYVGGADITYKSEKPVAMDVCNNPHSIKTVDGGTIFATDRGLMIISGSQVQELSAQVEGKPLLFNNNTKNEYIDLFTQAISNGQLTQLNSAVGENFLQFIKEAIFGYNHFEKELWITVPGKFTYSLKNGVWTKINITGTEYVRDYPKEYLLSNGKLLDINKEKQTDTELMFLTRPIKAGTQRFKQMMRAVLRADIISNELQYSVNSIVDNYTIYQINGDVAYVYREYPSSNWYDAMQLIDTLKSNGENCRLIEVADGIVMMNFNEAYNKGLTGNYWANTDLQNDETKATTTRITEGGNPWYVPKTDIFKVMVMSEIEMKRESYYGFYVFGSIDGIKWKFLGGREKKGRTKDIGMTVERIDCKYFRFGFSGRISADSNFTHIEISVNGKMDDKLR